ncbi:MAG: JAB domain-containing protein [Ferrovum myxofaciens]
MDAITKTRKSRQIKADTHQTACVVQTEDLPPYGAEIEDGVIQKALNILASRIRKAESFLNSPGAVRGHHREANCFRVPWPKLPYTPERVVKRVLHHNAAAVILAHNPSKWPRRTKSGRQETTEALREILDPIDARVLDHFIVAGTECISFAEHGLL